jgi:hypothetical protein
VIAYRATSDVPRETVQFTAQLLAAERRRRGAAAGMIGGGLCQPGRNSVRGART